MKETIANLTRLPKKLVDVIKGYLKGSRYINTSQSAPIKITSSRSHGMVMAVKKVFTQLGFEALLASRSSRQRKLICAMVCARIIKPNSKTASLRWWQDTTIPKIMGVEDVEPSELFEALDWLDKNQTKIEKRLAKKHLKSQDAILYDLSSSYVEGQHCHLAQYGYSRDKRSDKKQINYGLLCDSSGRPVSITVYEGNVSDSKTLIFEITKIEKDFGLSEIIIVGDRGMIVKTHLEALKSLNIQWVTALRSNSIKKLIKDKTIQPSPELTLCEISHKEYPQERLIVCRNPDIAKKRKTVRESLVTKTEQELKTIQDRVKSGALYGKAEIGVKFGSILKIGVGKHFNYAIEDNNVTFSRNHKSIDLESASDGIYIVRTSLSSQAISSQDCVNTYKSLAKVERAFRCLKTSSLHIRPIYHRLNHRVKAHMFLCMLAYYVEWHLRKVWTPLLLVNIPNNKDSSSSSKEYTESNQEENQESEEKDSYHTLLSHMNYH